MTETEKFKRFKKHLLDGNFEGVRETFEREFMEEIIDEDQYEIEHLIRKEEILIVWGLRPIHFACLYGNFEIVKLLIENKCNIESEMENGLRSIHLACCYGDIQIVKQLIFQNCLINVSDKFQNRKTPLDWAKTLGHGEIVKLISELDKVTKQINDSILKNDHERPSFTSLIFLLA